MICTGLQGLALLIYVVSFAGFVVFLVRNNRWAGTVANIVLGIGFVFHTVSLIIGTARLGQLPVLNVYQALGFFGWSLVGVYFILFWRVRLVILGAFASPLALALLTLSIFLGGPCEQAAPIYRSLWLTLHLATVFGGYGFFGLAFVAGIMYLIQEREIKAKRTGAMYHRLPSLNVLDTINYYCLSIGFPLMTLGIITGMVYAWIYLGRYWRWDPKEVWSLILWLVYAALLHQRLTVGWRGRKAAVMSMVGFLVLCFTFLGVSLLLPGYHSLEGLRQLSTP